MPSVSTASGTGCCSVRTDGRRTRWGPATPPGQVRGTAPTPATSMLGNGHPHRRQGPGLCHLRQRQARSACHVRLDRHTSWRHVCTQPLPEHLSFRRAAASNAWRWLSTARLRYTRGCPLLPVPSSIHRPRPSRGWPPVTYHIRNQPDTTEANTGKKMYV